MQLDQLAIALTGATAAWLTQSRNERARKYACVFGIIGQPFWLWASWKTQQWGIFIVSILYAAAWVRGLWVHWIAPSDSSSIQTLEFPKR